MKDLKITYQGNFIVEKGDLAVSSDNDCIERAIGLRMRTPPSCRWWPGIGIARFAGVLASERLTRAVESIVRQQLTSDGLLQSPIIEVKITEPGILDVTVSGSSPSGSSTKKVYRLQNGIVQEIAEPSIAETNEIATDTSNIRPATNKYLKRNRSKF